MDETQLLEGCLRNDRRAQHALYQQYAAPMMGLCYRYTRQSTDAEEVLQEGFVKVFRNIEQYKGQGALAGWIKQVMVRTAIDFLRKNKAYKLQLQLAEDLPETPVEANTLVWQNAEALVEAIRQLPAGYQTVFNLVGIEGYAHEEVSQLLGISVQTSRSQYHRARNLLKMKLQHEKATAANLSA